MNRSAGNTDNPLNTPQQRLGHVAPLGRLLGNIMASRVEPQYNMVSSVSAAWEKIAPAELTGRCRITGLDNGVLTVEVDSPACMYQLRLHTADLIKKLRSRCPRAAVQKIRSVVSR
jgi:hypothetical protein